MKHKNTFPVAFPDSLSQMKILLAIRQKIVDHTNFKQIFTNLEKSFGFSGDRREESGKFFVDFLRKIKREFMIGHSLLISFLRVCDNNTFLSMTTRCSLENHRQTVINKYFAEIKTTNSRPMKLIFFLSHISLRFVYHFVKFFLCK